VDPKRRGGFLVRRGGRFRLFLEKKNSRGETEGTKSQSENHMGLRQMAPSTRAEAGSGSKTLGGGTCRGFW